MRERRKIEKRKEIMRERERGERKFVGGFYKKYERDK